MRTAQPNAARHKHDAWRDRHEQFCCRGLQEDRAVHVQSVYEMRRRPLMRIDMRTKLVEIQRELGGFVIRLYFPTVFCVSVYLYYLQVTQMFVFDGVRNAIFHP